MAPAPDASTAQQAEQARHTARLPQIASYHALVHAYANAHAFRWVSEFHRVHCLLGVYVMLHMKAGLELQQQYQAAPAAAAC